MRKLADLQVTFSKMLQSKYYWILISVWVIILIGLLMFLYMPWNDEICFANMSSNFLATGKFSDTLAIRQTGKEIIIYGPVTFWVQSTLFYIFGEGIFVARIINVFFGIALFFLIYNWIKSNYTAVAAKLVLLFLLTDMAILTLLMCGRLDFIPVFLFSFGLFRFLKAKNLGTVFISGILFSLAFLSTPRMGIYLLAFAPFFIIECYVKRNFKELIIKYAVVFISFIMPLCLWIFIKFGSLSKYISYYSENPLIKQHTGAASIPPKIYQIVPFLVILLILLYRFKNKIKIPNHVWLFISIIILHVIFIKEVGPYSGMMMPFVYLLLAILIDKQLIQNIKSLKYILLIYLSCMFFVFMLKVVVTVFSFSGRNPVAYENQIAKKITVTSKTKVLADFKYYYILRDMKVNYKPFNYNADPTRSEDLYKFDYIIVDDSGLKKIRNLIPNENIEMIPIVEDQTKIKLPSFLNGFYNDYNGWIITLNTSNSK